MSDKKPPKWKAKVPEPETIVIYEDGQYRAELISYIEKGDRVKDIRVRGPARLARREAMKDGVDLFTTALTAGYDSALFEVRKRRKELESVKYKLEDFVDEEAEKRALEEAKKRKEANLKEMQAELNAKDVLAQMAARTGALNEKYKPVGPKWLKPGSMVSLPLIRGQPETAWLIHEKQDAATGKHRPWLFFNGATGLYYRQKDADAGYIQIGVPHAPQEYPMSVHVGSASLLSSAGKKLDFAVLLPELHKTGFLLKQPLEFMDKPASLAVLCDGLRNAPAAAEFCVRKFHSVLLPKLSARSTEFEDFELVDLLRDCVESLDGLILNSPACFAGCSIGVTLQIGTRVVLGSLGGVRCILLRPPEKFSTVGVSAKIAASRAAVAATAPWTTRCIAGGELNSFANDDERLRVESAGNQICDCSMGLSGRSASPAMLAKLPDERERLLAQVSRATGCFAALGLTIADLKAGAASIRSLYRRRSLVVHPDKVGAALRERAVGVFAKLEKAATTVQAMLEVDAQATELIFEIDAAHDSGKLGAEPSVAAKLLGVEEGSTSKVVKEAIKRKFHAPLGRLQSISVAYKDVERALKALEVAEQAVARGTQLWIPQEADESVLVTRALGCKDLKTPVPLLNSSFTAECIDLEPGTIAAVAMVADGAQAISESQIAKIIARHSPCRPRAAALRIALEGTQAALRPGDAAGVICGYFDYTSGFSASSESPAAKRAKVAKPDRVRVSHVLLRWAGLKGEDEFSRPGISPATRTQAEAEKALLELLEQLLAGEPKTLGARFKAEVLKQSECQSALTVPYADLGWMEPGGAEASLEIACFGMASGCVSDVIISSRGAHLMYRLG